MTGAPHLQSRRGGIGLRLLLLLVVIFAAGALAWMLFLPAVVMSHLHTRTGFAVDVATLSVNPFTGRVAVRGLTVRNPSSFPVPDFVLVRGFEADADMWSLFSDRLVLDELRLDVARVKLVRRAGGESNAELFQRGLIGGLPVASGAGPVGASPAPARKYLIRKLTLRFDQLAIADYSGPQPAIHEYHLGLDQTYTNVTDPRQLLVPGVLRSLMVANVEPGLPGLIPGDFGRALGDATRGAAKTGAELLHDAGRKTTETFKGLLEKLEEYRKP